MTIELRECLTHQLPARFVVLLRPGGEHAAFATSTGRTSIEFPMAPSVDVSP